jgi:hypothetical protein
MSGEKQATPVSVKNQPPLLVALLTAVRFFYYISLMFQF